MSRPNLPKVLSNFNVVVNVPAFAAAVTSSAVNVYSAVTGVVKLSDVIVATIFLPSTTDSFGTVTLTFP